MSLRKEVNHELMARTKNLNTVVAYGETGYIINDLEPDKSPRFELYHIYDKKSIKKSDNPWDFDGYMLKIWEKEREIESAKI